ncbi:hypothetical protein [Friedmanniella luteola]|uniref:hypothetical protein n=1 Tax=Friedmanniella luteola TaxID=546871 RepID=UPI000B8A4DA9|nr:hypothetical protein [Friedmanniella luteola]
MVRKPPNVEGLGFTDEQSTLLNHLDVVGNNGWARTSQTEAMLPPLLAELEATGVSLAQIQQAMASVGYDESDLHQLARWDSKRRTGRFGR